MTGKMLPADAELYRRIDEVVHYIWDPIGIRGFPQARDEYYSYLAAILGRVKAGREEDIVEYLRWVQSERMGLSFDERKAREAAKIMLAWKEEIMILRDYPFEVGKIYENRRGLYEVTAIDPAHNRLRVRYVDASEEQDLSLSSQARVRRNMNWDALDEKRSQAQGQERLQSHYGVGFTGLQATDFKTDTTGTTWRSRRGLAGKVARRLAAGAGYAFVSWAIYGWPVAFLTHHEDYRIAAHKLGVRKAKFTLEVDERQLYYGLYVERNAGLMDHTWDWPRLMSLLYPGSPLAKQLAEVEQEQQLQIVGRAFAGSEETRFHFSNGLQAGARSLWAEDNPRSLPLDERLRRLVAVPDNQWIEIYILGSITKGTAVAAGRKIATVIADTMKVLLPFYEAASGRRRGA